MYFAEGSLPLLSRHLSQKDDGQSEYSVNKNMAPLFCDLLIGFLSDLFGLSLFNYRQIHRSAVLMCVAFLVLQVCIAIRANPICSLCAPGHRYLVIVSRSTTYVNTSLIQIAGSVFSRPTHGFSLRFVRTVSYPVGLGLQGIGGHRRGIAIRSLGQIDQADGRRR